MKNKRNRKSFEGSYTIEAAFVMWIVTVLISAVIYFGIYLHDRLKLYSEALYFVQLTGHMLEEPVSENGRLNEQNFGKLDLLDKDSAYWKKTGSADFTLRFLSAAKKQLLSMRVEDASFSISEKGVSLSYRAGFVFPGGKILKNLTDRFTAFTGKVTYEIKVYPEEFLRLCHGIMRKRE